MCSSDLIRISWNHLYQPGIDTFVDLLRSNAVFRLWLYFIYDASGKMPDSDSDCYGRAGRRRYDLCGDGKPEQAAIAEGGIPDRLSELLWQEKEKVIHTDGSGCKEQQPDERGGSSKKQWKLYIPAGSGKILWPAWNRLSDQVCAL